MKIKIGLILLIASFFIPTAFGQLITADNLKVGYVFMNKAINESQEGQRSKKLLEAQANRTKQMLAEKEQTIIAGENDLKNNIMLNDTAKAQKREELDRMKNELREEVGKAQQSLRQNEAKHTSKIFNELIGVINTIAKDENFDLILEYNLRQTILYSKYEMIDVTDQVVEAYNNLKSNP